MKTISRLVAVLVCACLAAILAQGVAGQEKKESETAEAPYNLWRYRDQVGQTLSWEIVGTAIGNVVGTDVYGDDSRLSAAAVHGGVLKDGERGVVRVKLLPGQNEYKGSTRNGVSSRDYGKWYGSFRFVTEPTTKAQAKAALPLPAKTVVVWPVAVYADADGHHHGSCHPLRITVGGESPGAVQIAFAESEVGGAGPQWRAAGWTASLTAAELTDFAPLTTQVAFNIRGRIDGPSAGALMTIGVLAAARGDSILPEVTMTGTINPDGFIGPVGGIVHKIEGAGKAGKKMLVIPPGIAVQEHADTHAPTNLDYAGERQGVKVVPARDIYAAYRLLTGVELPRPPEPKEELPEYRLGPIYGISANWAGRRREKDLWGLPDNQLTPEIEALIEKSKTILRHAEELNEEGARAAMMHGYLEGVGAQYEAVALVRCVVAYQNSGMEGVLDLLRKDSWLQKEEEAAATALKGYEILTVEQMGVQLQGLDAFLQGISQRAVAAKLLATLPASSEDAQYAAACRVSVYQSLAKASFQLASDYAEWAREPRGTLIADNAPLAQMADFYGRAGNANEAVFDSLIVNPQATAHSVTAEQMKNNLMQRDRDYATLGPASASRENAIERYFATGKERVYAQLAAGIYSYWRAAALVAKHYSLDAKLDRQMQISGLGREKTFYEWLEASDRATYRNIARVQALGIDPMSCQYLYDIAHVIRGRDLPSRLEALTLFFRANVESRLLVQLARRENP